MQQYYIFKRKTSFKRDDSIFRYLDQIFDILFQEIVRSKHVANKCIPISICISGNYRSLMGVVNTLIQASVKFRTKL